MAMPNVTPNEKVSAKPHPAPLASTQDSPNVAICEIDGKVEVQQAELLPVASGADTHDVKRLVWQKSALRYSTFLLTRGQMHTPKHAKNG